MWIGLSRSSLSHSAAPKGKEKWSSWSKGCSARRSLARSLIRQSREGSSTALAQNHREVTASGKQATTSSGTDVLWICDASTTSLLGTCPLTTIKPYTMTTPTRSASLVDPPPLRFLVLLPRKIPPPPVCTPKHLLRSRETTLFQRVSSRKLPQHWEVDAQKWSPFWSGRGNARLSPLLTKSRHSRDKTWERGRELQFNGNLARDPCKAVQSGLAHRFEWVGLNNDFELRLMAETLAVTCNWRFEKEVIGNYDIIDKTCQFAILNIAYLYCWCCSPMHPRIQEIVLCSISDQVWLTKTR